MAGGGCVDAQHQSLALILAALGPEDVSRVRLGRLTPYTCGLRQTLQNTISSGLVCACAGSRRCGTCATFSV
jgi:hypothetical protein